MDLVPAVLQELQAGRLPSYEILSLLLTRMLSYVLSISACFIRIPQILIVVRNKSAAGLSIYSFEMDILIGAIHTAYGYTMGVHSSLYGEAVAVLAQCIVLVSFIYYYSRVSIWRPAFIFGLFIAWTAYVLSGAVSIRVVSAAFVGNQFLFVWSRILQISKTAREKNVEQLSLGSYAPAVVGKAIRVLTSLKEKAFAYAGAHTLGFTMNSIMVLQILYYRYRASSADHKKKE